MADAYECLSSLRVVLRLRRDELKEKLAKGVEEGHYREYVGRCKELTDSIEKIGQQIKSLNGGDDDETKPLSN